MPNKPPTYRPHTRNREQHRGTRTERGYSNRWLRAAKAYLANHPLCVECEKQGKAKTATVVDHITPHKGDERLFWDDGNWQGLCVPHHNAKSAGEKQQPSARLRT